MAKSFPKPSLLPSVISQKDDAIYKEIIDKKMTSDRHQRGKTNGGLPGEDNLTTASPSLNADGSSMFDTGDSVPCPTCRGTGAINAGTCVVKALVYSLSLIIRYFNFVFP